MTSSLADYVDSRRGHPVASVPDDEARTLHALFTKPPARLQALSSNRFYLDSASRPSEVTFKIWMELYTDVLSILSNIPKHAPALYQTYGSRADVSHDSNLAKRCVPALWLRQTLEEMDFRDDLIEYYTTQLFKLAKTAQQLTEDDLWRVAKSHYNGAQACRTAVRAVAPVSPVGTSAAGAGRKR